MSAPPILPVRFPGPREFLAEWERSLSQGALFVGTPTPAPFGTTVRLALELPNGGGTIPILGQVAFVVPPNAPQAKRPGMGLRFRFDPQTEAAVRSFVHQLSRGSNAGRVLVVDDDALIRQQLSDLLTADGFRVTLAPHAIKALDLLKHDSFDVILCDVNMPRMDGFEFRDNLLRDPKSAKVPFLMISSSVDAETRETAKKLGARAFVQKPIGREPLLTVLRNAIAEYAASTPAAEREQKKTATSGVRDRRIVEIAFRKMTALGMAPRFTADERGVVGRVVFSRPLSNAFTRAPIPEARLRNVGHDRVRFTAPPHLTTLPDVPILDLPDAAAFERAVAGAYAARAHSQVAAKQLFDKFRLRAELDDAAFRVVARVKSSTDEVTFSVADAKTIVLESLNGRSFGPVMGEGARRIDISDATSGVDVELELGTVLKQYRGELERLVAEAAKRAAEEQKLWLEEQPPADLQPAPRASAAPERGPDRSLFAKAGEFNLEDLPPAPAPAPEPAMPELELVAPEPEPEPEHEPEPPMLELDAGALESLDDVGGDEPGAIPDLFAPSEPTPMPDPIPAITDPAPLPPSADAVLLCATCGKHYALPEEIEDERLLTSCPDCVAAGNALA